jgi:deoxyinosine 3'endonuclease (endonuclease V)
MLLAHIGLMAGFLLVFITVGIAKQPLRFDGESQ